MMSELTEYGVMKITIDKDSKWNVYFTEIKIDGKIEPGKYATYELSDLVNMINRILITNKELYKDKIKDLDES